MLIAENSAYEEQLAEFDAAPIRDYWEQQIAINQYRLDHDIPPTAEYTMWQFVSESTGMIMLAGLIAIVVAAGIVANEFSWGTIKVLLVKPFHRWKILLSKYIAVNLFLLSILSLLFVSLMIVGLVLFGKGGEASSIHLAYVDGVVVEKNLLPHLINTYLLNSLGVFFLVTMAYMISAAFRISSLAVGVSIFLLLIGDIITTVLAMNFSWAKFILFANTNLGQYIDGTPLIEGMTMSFSITMLCIYFVIFHLLALVFFTKRDVST